MKRLVLGLVGVVALVCLAGYLWLRASLPPLDGVIVATGLEATATIARDAEGVPVISAATRQDLAFATGFAHGQDRFFQMDLIRRQAAGELAAVFGPAALGSDRRFRLHRFRHRAGQVLANATAAERAIVERYADGVNAGLQSLAAWPFEYRLAGAEPAPWQPEDSILVVYAMFVSLNDSLARKDVRRGLAQRILPPRVYAWMYPQGTEWDAPLMGQARNLPLYPNSATYDVRGAVPVDSAANERGRPPLDGSNNWAVSGGLTATGRALVSNDMHLRLTVPNIYYQARLRLTAGVPVDISGVTLPGAPFVVAGSNGYIAWGYTNSYGDWSDAVLLREGASEGTYRTPDGDAVLENVSELIEVKDGDNETMTIRESRWGPIDEAANYPDGDIAVNWLAHRVEAVNLNIMQLETATSVADAMAIANTMGMPPQNFVVGDAGGNIGWTIAGRIPIRGDYDAMVPADWSVADGWLGWLAPDDYPRVENPDSGRIWTANARVADGAALDIIGDGGYDLGARSQQIRDALFAAEQFTPRDMLAIQTDDRALFLQRWQALLLALLNDETVGDDAALLEYRDLVQDWIPRAAPDSVGYRLVRAFRLEVRSRVFNGLMAMHEPGGEETPRWLVSNQFEGPLWQLLEARPPHLLPAGYDDWNALLLSAVRENIRYFGDEYDGGLSERSWGEYNTAAIQHPLSRAVPLLSRWLDMPKIPQSGDANLPRAQGPDFGASQRFSVSPGDEAAGLMQMPTGQSGHPLSDFYRAGHDAWAKGEPRPFLPGVPQHTLTLEPAEATLATSAN